MNRSRQARAMTVLAAFSKSCPGSLKILLNSLVVSENIAHALLSALFLCLSADKRFSQIDSGVEYH